MHFTVVSHIGNVEPEGGLQAGKVATEEPQKLEEEVDYEQKVIEDLREVSDEFDKFSSDNQDQFIRMVNEVKQAVEKSIEDWIITNSYKIAAKAAALPDVDKH